MKRSEIRAHLARKWQRQQTFFAGSGPDLLLYPAFGDYVAPSSNDPRDERGLKGAVYRAVVRSDESVIPDEYAIDKAVGEFLVHYRSSQRSANDPTPGDSIPCLFMFYDIGWMTAAITGLTARYSGGAWWLEPNLDWDSIGALRFDPDNPWLLTARHVFRALWRHWGRDFWSIPLTHRSPLDYANGIRGTELFLEMRTEPSLVKQLLDWCVNWQLEAERFVYEGADVYEGWGTGIMQTWGPDRAVWVNGDPVGLISRETMLEFEQPYTARLFTSTGGGFFHNHTLGLHQVDQVAKTAGIHMQNFARDPNCPTVTEALIADSQARERIIGASLQTPIYVTGITAEELRETLPILRQGRFMLQVYCKASEVGDLSQLIHGSPAAR